MNLLITVAAGAEMDTCKTNAECDFSKRLICQLVDTHISTTYKRCVRHCENDFECRDNQFCSCGSGLDGASDSSRELCAMGNTSINATAYCKNNTDASTISSKCFSEKQLTSSMVNKTCGKSGTTLNAGSSCNTYRDFGIHMKGCKCASGYTSHYACKSCLVANKCDDCINGYELDSDEECQAICREGLNFVGCKCGALKTEAAPNMYCHQEKSVVCGMAGCSNCSANISQCDLCADGFLLENEECLRKCASLTDTDCLCGSGQTFQNCPDDHPACDTVSGKCSLKCDENISANCQNCNTTAASCSQCNSGYGCIKDGSLLTTDCATACTKVCEPSKIQDCICHEESTDLSVPSVMCGGNGFSCHDNKCIECADKCDSCYIDGSSTYVCRKCASGFGFDTATKTSCIQLCDSQIDTNCSCGGVQNCNLKGLNFACYEDKCLEKRECNSNINNCERCWESSSVCMQCIEDRFCVRDGEYVSEDCPQCYGKCNTADCICLQSSECEKGLACSDNKCKPCFSNCQECSSADTCDICAPGYGLRNTTSKTECILLCNEDQRENCSCGTSGQCDIDNGFHCVNNTCEKKKTCQEGLLDSCDKCWLDPNVCMQCKADRFCLAANEYTQEECMECLLKCTADAWENCVCLSQQQCPSRMACHDGGCVACAENCRICTSSQSCNICDPGYACENAFEGCEVCQEICTEETFECLCGDAKIKCIGEQKCLYGKCTDLCANGIVEDCYCPGDLTLQKGKCLKMANPMTTIIAVVVSVVVVLGIVILLLVLRMLKKKKSKANVRQAGFSIKSYTEDSLEDKKLEEKRKKKSSAAKTKPEPDRAK